jgi:hypothetical protein
VLLNDEVHGPYPTVYNVPWGQPVLVVGSGTYGKYINDLHLEFDQYGVITSWVLLLPYCVFSSSLFLFFSFLFFSDKQSLVFTEWRCLRADFEYYRGS